MRFLRESWQRSGLQRMSLPHGAATDRGELERMMFSAISACRGQGSTKVLAEDSNLSIVLVELERGMTLKWHRHTHAQICLVLRGAYEERTKNIRAQLQEGSVFFRSPSELHMNRVSPLGAAVLLLDFHDSLLKDTGDVDSESVYFEDGPFIDILAELRRELRTGDSLSQLTMLGLARLVQARIHRLQAGSVAKRVSAVLNEAMKILESTFQAKTGLSALACRLGRNPATVAKEFRKHLGVTVGEYIRKRRIQYVKEALATEKSFAEIAQEAGFYDESHMTRVFRRHEGCSPAAIRRLQSTAILVPRSPRTS
jgi:AraC family transcriptional regulator